jgi:ubiquitin C-terminal hydrolase
MDLSLEIPKKKSGYKCWGSSYGGGGGSISLSECLTSFAAEEDIGTDYRCDNCNKRGSCKRKTSIYTLPKILVIHLKRFSFDSYSSKKISTSVTFPVTGLNLSEYCVGSSFATYNLYGISHHSGYMGGGHYVADTLNNGKWYHCDDSNASKSYSDPQGSGDSPYVLFYARSDMAKL